MKATVPIASVLVTEDRAHVRRRGRVSLAAGVNRVEIDGVAPVLADKTLRVRVESQDAKVEVGEARVLRRRVAVTPKDEHADLAALLDAREKDVERSQGAVARARGLVALLDEAQRRALVELAEDGARGLALDPRTPGHYEARERTAWQDLRKAEHAQRELEREVARLRARLAQVGHVAERVVADLEITLAASADVAADVVVEYLVPGACWRPQHTARLEPGGLHLSLETDACVWQNTGEDWMGVELRLSTERPSLGQKPPRLDDDELVAKRKSDVIRVEQRDVAVQTTGLGVGAPGAEAARVPGIDDGGEVRVFTAAGTPSVPSDGRPHRVPVASMKAPAETSLVAYPELAEAVLVRARQTNTGKGPVLAGPVDLVRESGFVGRTKIALIAPGERFELGFGPDPHLRVRRSVEVVAEEPGLLPTSYVGRWHRVVVHVSNLDDAKRSLSVTERIPVSEMEKVQVEQDEKKTTPRAKADDNGFVRWDVELGPRERTTLTLRYLLRHHRDVVGL